MHVGYTVSREILSGPLVQSGEKTLPPVVSPGCPNDLLYFDHGRHQHSQSDPLFWATAVVGGFVLAIAAGLCLWRLTHHEDGALGLQSF